MTSFALEELLHLARLSRLRLDDDALDAMRGTLSDILALIDQMQNTDTSGVEPMSSPLALDLRLEDDVASENIVRETFQAMAPQVEEGLYLVPKVIE